MGSTLLCGAIPEGTIDSELFGHEKALLLEQQALVKVILKWLTAERFSR
jgi:transcriptional regulator of aromatic amino acid metabolism